MAEKKTTVEGAPSGASNPYQAALDAGWNQTREQWIAFAQDLAAKLTGGVELNHLERVFAAKAVKYWAETRPEHRPSSAGNPAKFDRESAAELMVIYHEFPGGPRLTQLKAAQTLTQVFGVEEEAILKAYQKRGPAIRKRLGLAPRKNS